MVWETEFNKDFKKMIHVKKSLHKTKKQAIQNKRVDDGFFAFKVG